MRRELGARFPLRRRNPVGIVLSIVDRKGQKPPAGTVSETCAEFRPVNGRTRRPQPNAITQQPLARCGSALWCGGKYARGMMMARKKKEVAQRAARHGMRAHILYETAVEVRNAAEGLEVVGEPIAQELRAIAKRLDARRRRIMAQPKEPMEDS